MCQVFPVQTCVPSVPSTEKCFKCSQYRQVCQVLPVQTISLKCFKVTSRHTHKCLSEQQIWSNNKKKMLVQLYGNSHGKLFVKRMSNRMYKFSLFSFPIYKIIFISLSNLFISRRTIILFLDWINQFLVMINSNPMALLIQFKGRLLISVVGSKIENRFLITFNLYLC